MAKNTGLWIVLAGIAGFCVFALLLVGVLGAFWYVHASRRTPPVAVVPAPTMMLPPGYTPDSPQMPVMPPMPPRSSAIDDAVAQMGPGGGLTPQSPLAPQAPAMPSPAPGVGGQPPGGAGDVPAGYTLINATNAGRAFATDKDKLATVNDALEAGLDDLDDYFDTDYDVTAKYEDQRDHRSGVALFEAQRKGVKVKGYVMTHLREKGANGAPAGGATLVIVFASATATQAQWAQLTGAPAGGGQAGSAGGQVGGPAGQQAQGNQQQVANGNGRGNAQPAPAPQGNGQPLSEQELARLAAAVPLKTYRFPDGTGTVGLANGWTTTAQSCHTSFIVNGPNGEKISFGLSVAVNTPNSTAVQLARQYGTGGAPLYVGNFADPATVLNTILPQLSDVQARAGGPTVTLDHLATMQKLPPVTANSQNAILSYGVTLSQGGRQQHFTAISQVSVTPISNESFMVWSTEMAAPDAAFQQDLPAMIAMVNSCKTDDAVMQQKTDQWVAQSNANFQAGQAANRDLQNTYSQYNQAQANNSVIRSRAVDDFDETIRGVRDVQDTRTGQQAPVDLGNVDNIVNNLNQGDPGRYIQVPLRDQADPLPRQR